MKIWKRILERLREFLKVHGHTNVPPNWEPDRVLSQWVENIRLSRNKLPQELLDELKKLKFDFQHKTQNTWSDRYAQLVSFWKKHGHTYIPQDEQYQELSTWTQNQRSVKSQLPVKQVALLDELGFDWAANTKKRNAWEFMYHELELFKEKYGHVKVVHTDREHFPLATWMHNTRARADRLDPEQKKKLDALGFLWSEDLQKQIESKWSMRFEELKEFKKSYGHCNVPIKWKPNKKLAVWVSEQRLREKNSGLLPERKKRLDKIGFSWSEDLTDQYEAHWLSMFTKLKKYKSKYGHTVITSKDRDLKMWAMSQRIMKKLGMLSSDKQDKLDSVGLIWEKARENQWEKMYQELRQYKSKFGNILIIQRSKYPALGDWAIAQRKKYAKGTLSEERIRKLNKAGFIWTNAQKSNWTEMYDQLADYKGKFGHINVSGTPPEYKQLARWAYKRRMKWKEGKLSNEEFRLLDKLGFDWHD